MKQKYKFMTFLWVVVVLASCKTDKNQNAPMAENTEKEYYSEPYRPQFHFSPETMWTNDPNGMVYNKGVYHLFYQHHPESTKWGPMHWGHAISKDLLHWENKPIALYPDENGAIFSGCAVVDSKNTSGLGTAEKPPLVAIYTYHNAEKEKAGETGFQTQGLAFSLDNGESWTKYEDNPIISGENETDFRDPKIFWYEPDGKWIMSLVAGDHAEFYGSKNLLDWELLGEFGKDKGAHGGVWECPDLLKFKVDGSDEEKWVLLISINPGAPNGGSGTQYFVGDFDGKTFTTEQTEDRWIDWGTDNYAGVTFSNTPNDETIFMGWMSNWKYANETPTEKWRGAMTLPRKLSLQKVGDDYALFNYPIEKVNGIITEGSEKDFAIGPETKETVDLKNSEQAEIRFMTSAKDYRITFLNEGGDEMTLSLKGDSNEFSIDRSQSGKVDFNEDFGKMVQSMPVAELPEEYEMRILMDRSSVEVFINKGQYVMTAQVFPNAPFTGLTVENSEKNGMVLKNFEIGEVERTW